MRGQSIAGVVVVATAGAAMLGGMAGYGQGTEPGATAVSVDADDLGGVVTSTTGPEAGVWVIAETFDLATGYRKIVVTDDEGRYVLPDLPAANYTVWVRGYGLVDGPKVETAPGEVLNLTATTAPSAAAAAEYYPAQYWYALVEPPPKDAFPGTGQGPEGNGIDQRMRNQQEYLGEMRNRTCGQCHAIGSKHTREMPQNFGSAFDSTYEAWERRVQRGQWGPAMLSWINTMGHRGTLEMYADWTDRVMGGELPEVPPRPRGVERNLVITQWDWAKDTSYVHDNASTDVRDPTVNAYGRIYGAEQFAGEGIHILDPMTHEYSWKRLPAINYEKITPGLAPIVPEPSRFYGDEILWTARTDTHFPIMDQLGRTWFTAKIRSADDTPAYCSSPDHPSAKLRPIRVSAAGFAMYDPRNDETTAIPLCGAGGHANFAYDTDHTLWTTTTNWFRTRVWDETGDASQAEGWTDLVADTNGNGTRDEYVELDEPLDPTKDHEIQGGSYGVAVSPVDGSVWGTQNEYPGGVSHLIPGPNPPETALAEFFEFPLIDPERPELGHTGYDPRGINADTEGVVWMSLSMGGMASFDRRKCADPAPLQGPKAMDPQTCREAWTIYPSPGPNFKGVTDPGSADFHYWATVDKYGLFGVGREHSLHDRRQFR